MLRQRPSPNAPTEAPGAGISSEDRAGLNRSREHPPASPAPVVRIRPAEIGLLGASPAFAEPILVGRPNMPDRATFLARMEQVLDSGRLTNFGPMVQQFEARVAEMAGARYCVTTCNATAGLEVAIAAMGLGGEVIVPSFTFAATVHALWRQGVRPVFCDVDPHTHCLDPARVEAAITPETTAILGVHLWGTPCAPAALDAIARRHGLRLLFDAAHAIGCHDPEAPRHGDAEVFSFHATKCIHAFEGGAVVTDDPDLARRMRLAINFGFSGEDTVEMIGTNAKMSEASAAMGLSSLDRLDEIVAHNRRNHAAYAAGLAAIPGVRVRETETGARQNWQYVVAEIGRDAAGLTRDELVAALRFENIVARRYFAPGCHRIPLYAEHVPQAGRDLPVTEALAERVMVLPTGQAVETAHIDRLCARLGAIVRNAPAIRRALAQCRDPRRPTFLPPVPAPETGDHAAGQTI